MDSAPSADKVTSATDIAMEQNIPVEEGKNVQALVLRTHN